ncbi:J domain-containing protein [Halobaculum sp. MBLA0143]|uniref:J domain-containing protein n=1 Tax=Halobaculum sp. MBLA0143 TaxID=3079933 RepID=UPI0035256050
MDRDTLVLGIAAVFAGTFVTMSVLALSHSLFLAFVAVPFGAAAYFMWWQVSGDLEERFRGRRAPGDRRAAEARRRAAEGTTGGSSRFAEEARKRAAEGAAGRERRRAAGARAGSGRGPGTAGSTGMPAREAYDTLDLSPDASNEEVKSAYRDRVKEVHPDSGGDEEAFKRVNRAYETLRED